ncbi:MAG: Kelch repeat-containing protein [Chloroflexia bacterium]
MPEHSSPSTFGPNQEPPEAPSHLFLLRLWPDDGPAGEGTQWSGKVQHMITGQIETFLGWPALVETLSAMLTTAEKRRTHFGSDPRSGIKNRSLPSSLRSGAGAHTPDPQPLIPDKEDPMDEHRTNSPRTQLPAIIILLALVVSSSFTAGAAPAAQGASRLYPETGKTLQGRFLQYWDTHGGLAQQGYPISEELRDVSDTDGKAYTVQYLERAVFELHPENAQPYDVLLSLLGVSLYHQKYPQGAPGPAPSAEKGARLFSQTGKTVGGLFLSYWDAHGGLAQQGYPISTEFAEKSDLDGKTYVVQYFERAVFELHPENAPPNNVLLSQLGTFRYKARYAQSSPVSSPGTPAQPTATAGAQRTAGRLEPVGSMTLSRGAHTATLLQDGRVLLAGGQQRGDQLTNTADLYDPATGKFTPTGSMTVPRAYHSAALLPDGRVLIMGGSNADGNRSAELYDPATGKFTPTGSMTVGRWEPFAATTLKNGKVLVTGGLSDGKMTAVAELYDPSTGSFSPTGSMNEGRVNNTATLLADGRVLVVGGGVAGVGSEPDRVLASAELYDPITGAFTRTGNLLTARYKHGAALLRDGRVLIVAGSNERQMAGLYTSVEIYEPATGKFTSAGNVAIPRFKLPAGLASLPDGRVAIAGGGERVELYDPSSGSFSTAEGTMELPHYYQTATTLRDGTVLIAGGYNAGFLSTAQAWLYR